MQPYEGNDADGTFVTEELTEKIKKLLLKEYYNIAVNISAPFGILRFCVFSGKMKSYYSQPIRPYDKTAEAKYGKKAAILLGIIDIPTEDLVLASDNVCFLVTDEGFENRIPYLTEFFKAEGFRCKYSYENSSAVWINIETKVYGFSRKGINAPEPIGGHALTVDEFMTIYQIYKKHAGQDKENHI